MTGQSLLVRTPRQFADESPLGFALRVSEANGYVSPRSVFQLAGVQRDEMFTAWFNADKLARVLGQGAGEVRGFRTIGSRGEQSLALAGHALPGREIRTAHPKICLECVRELGYAPVWFDLHILDACPIHRRALSSFCTKCERELSWLRPGLLTCRCGADLSSMSGASITDTHAALLTQLIAKVMGREAEPHHGMPVRQFEAMSLEGLVAMCRGLSRLHCETGGNRAGTDAQRAAVLFCDWPSGLHAAIRMLDPSGESSGAVAMRERAEGVYRTWLSTVSSPADIAFLRDALAAFDGAAPTLHPSHGLFALPAIAPEPEPAKTQGRKIGIARGPRKRSAPSVDERSHGVRATAMRLGIPVSALRHLRARGVFEVRHRACPADAFHEQDIVAFEARVQQLWPRSFQDDVEGRAMPWVLARKFKHASGKGALIASILDNAIQVVGARGPGLPGLILNREQTDAFIEASRLSAFGGAVSPEDAAKVLQVEALAIPLLVKQGYLQGHRCAAGWRIRPGSLDDFQARYRSLAAVAAESGTASRVLMQRAQARGLQLLTLSPGTRRAPYPFVLKQDLEALLASPARTRGAERAERQQVRLKCTCLTFCDVARELECTPTVVPRLIAGGQLRVHVCFDAKRATLDSVQAFMQEYGSVAQIARVLGVGPTKLLNEATAHGFELLAVPRGKQASPQYFMKRADANTLDGPYETKAAARLRKSLAAKARKEKRADAEQ